MSSATRTIFFLGATGGVALSVLRRSLAAGHICVALCRTPSKLQSLLSESEANSPNLAIEQGNALNVDDLLRCLKARGPVDTIVSSIGGYMQFSKMRNDDPHVNENGMKALLQALSQYRAEQNKPEFSPRLFSVSTAGVSDVARRYPVLLIPLYATLIKSPAKDKNAMEKVLIKSQEKNWTIVRPSIFTDGPEAAPGTVMEGIEDPIAGVDVVPCVPGYTISRVDVGKWIFENLVQKEEEKYVKKAVMISY
ncbi:hypothetical protein V8F20_009518 [Naviculisporaceae sp. PSN 640]